MSRVSNKSSIEEFAPKSNQILLFDTNILIKLLYPIDFNGDVEKYAVLFEKIKRANAKLIISSIQVSEFINRCIRLQYRLYQQDNGENIDFKKDYRNTDDYKRNMTAILDIIKNDVINNFEFIDDGFSKMQYEKIFLYGFSYDFNDSLLVEIAEQRKAIIVTDDFDFANYNVSVPIVTGNRNLLKFR